MLSVPYIQSGKEEKAPEHMTQQTLQFCVFLSIKIELPLGEKIDIFRAKPRDK